jgi:hypothetical protein
MNLRIKANATNGARKITARKHIDQANTNQSAIFIVFLVFKDAVILGIGMVRVVRVRVQP